MFRVSSLSLKVLLILILGFSAHIVSGQVVSGAQAGASLGAVGSIPTDLTITAGDALLVTIFDTPELTGSYQVTGLGYINFPLIGQVDVSGKSTTEIATVIREQLMTKGFLVDPQVSVTLANLTNHSVTILGEVSRPGAVPLLGSHLLWDVVGSAGGATPAASNKVVILNKSKSQSQSFIIDWSRPIDGQPNPLVEVGDTIQILASGFVYVVGQVNHQAAIPIVRNDTHVSALLAGASGIMQTAKASQTRLIRRNPDGTRTVSKVDLNAILKGKADDIELRPNDILYVPYNLERAALARGVEAAISISTSLAYFAAVQ
jgi:polysaccharide biosynthesis/export protein